MSQSLIGVWAAWAGMASPLQAETTTVLVVRHAEKAPGNDDVPLSESGLARAAELAKIARGLRCQAAYATHTERARQTALPTAETVGKPVVRYPNPANVRDESEPAFTAFLARLLRDNAGKCALVVGHSTSAPTIVSKLLGPQDPPLDLQIGDTYDNLFIITIDGDRRSLVRLKYGANGH